MLLQPTGGPRTQQHAAAGRLAGRAVTAAAGRRRLWCRGSAAAEPATGRQTAEASSGEVPSSWPSEAARRSAYSTVSVEEVRAAPSQRAFCTDRWRRLARLSSIVSETGRMGV